MSNKIETVSIGDLPIATELDDADELLLRDASATLPENATARLSIATLRAAMGSPDRIESASGEAFAEATDDLAGAGVPGSIMGVESNGCSAQVVAGVVPSERGGFAWVGAGEEGDLESGARFVAHYNAETGVKALRATGAPLNVEEPVESYHAATKGYVDARPGADAWSEHAATQDVDLDGFKITGLGEPTDASDAATKAYVDAQAGPPDRIESPSGEAFVESTDDFMGWGIPGSAMIAESNGASGLVATYPGHAGVLAGPEGSYSGGAGFDAAYDPASDEYTLRAHGAPLMVEEPTDSNHAATKGYVDARPGAEEWSEHPATQDVDLDGHKITGLGEPTDAADAATKGYVDGAAPAKIELAGSRVEILPGGNIEIWRDGQLRLRIGNTNVDPSITLSTKGASGTEIHSGGSTAELRAGSGTIIGVEVWNGGRVYLYSGGTKYFLAVNGDALPAGVDSVVQAARRAYERRAELEWWDPVWTPVTNVDSVSNVECQYTRTYRAAGGSLVTLEGTIEVTPDAAGQCAVQADLPIARVGSGLLAGTAMAMEVTPPGHVVAVASVAETTLTLGFIAEGADPYLVGFRISYRAA